MAVKIKKGDSSGGINMTPMIDVVFQLMIFFLVATRLEETERELDVVLPQASEAKPLSSRPKELFINVDKTGRIMTGGEFVDLAQLEQVLRQAAANNPGRQTVIIRADEQAWHKHVVAVLNLCNRANIRDYRLATAEPGG